MRRFENSGYGRHSGKVLGTSRVGVKWSTNISTLWTKHYITFQPKMGKSSQVTFFWQILRKLLPTSNCPNTDSGLGHNCGVSRAKQQGSKVILQHFPFFYFFSWASFREMLILHDCIKSRSCRGGKGEKELKDDSAANKFSDEL